MFCTKKNAVALVRLMQLTKDTGRNIGRGEDRRLLAPISRIWLDYVCRDEIVVRYEKRGDRYSLDFLEAYLEFNREHQTKDIRTVSCRQVERIMAEGWCAVVRNGKPVQVSGDLQKMECDLSKLILCGDLEVS
jgi:hypothetical protein